jgi:hypothetical protein
VTDNADGIDSKGSAETIVPIDFTPNTGRGKGFRFSLRPAHFLIAAFLLLAAYASWFILTAKSVYIEVVPLTARIEISGGTAVRLGTRYLIHEGNYELTLQNGGYHDTVTRLLVGQAQS